MVDVLYFYAWLILAIVVHEFGHAAAARGLGLKVYRIEIGRGRILFTSTRLGFPFTVRLMPFSGTTYFASPACRFLRFRWWLAILAGPGTQVVTLGVIYATLGSGFVAYSIDQFFKKHAAHPAPLLGVLFLANVFLLVGSLLPYRCLKRLGGTSDGYRLITIPFFSRERFAEYEAAYLLLEADELYRSQLYGEGIEMRFLQVSLCLISP